MLVLMIIKIEDVVDDGDGVDYVDVMSYVDDVAGDDGVDVC